jgi:hypothetical protein
MYGSGSGNEGNLSTAIVKDPLQVRSPFGKEKEGDNICSVQKNLTPQ